MALDTVENLVKNRLNFITPSEDALLTMYKLEVYYELSPYFDIEQTEAEIEDDSNYTGTIRSLIADITSCYMLYWKSIVESLGEFGKIVYTEFVGAGLNDITFSGLYSGEEPTIFTVEIDATGTPDTFKWKKGSGSFTSGVSITGTPQLLEDGIYVSFAATTGHTLGDIWLSRAVPSVDSTTGFLKKGKAGPVEAEFEQWKTGGANASRLAMSMDMLLEKMKKTAYRKAHSLGLIIDICGDCMVAIDRIMDQPGCPPFLVGKLGWCNEPPPDNCPSC